jgi:hypothetical protein
MHSHILHEILGHLTSGKETPLTTGYGLVETKRWSGHSGQESMFQPTVNLQFIDQSVP